MAKCIIVKGVTTEDLAAMQTAVTNAGGTFIKHSADNLNFEAAFTTDAACATFHAAAIVIDPLYADADEDPLQALNVNQGKT